MKKNDFFCPNHYLTIYNHISRPKSRFLSICCRLRRF
nr:MAG TPA: hypothetical protein [Inoviridae sp.]